MATITLNHGDVVEQLKNIDDESIDAIITDPPYNLSFMGKKWDNKGAPKQFQEWCSAWSAECLRVLRRGGYLLSFGGTRTFHRIATGIEDAGFVIKDCLSWNYGSGFPKSHNISKAMDKAFGKVGAVIGEKRFGKTSTGQSSGWNTNHVAATGKQEVRELVSKEAQQWEGYGTALKPAWEPIILAQKPFKGTIVNNVLTHGVGGMNIDATRIESDGSHKRPFQPTNQQRDIYGKQTGFQPTNANGRFPANAIFDEEAGKLLDEQSGQMKSVKSKRGVGFNDSKVYGTGDLSFDTERGFNDTGGASRFFYCPKTPKKERNCMGYVENKHPTVKPIKLMEWLIKLVCPTSEAMNRQPVILDCFIGSGSTALAANRLNVDCIGIDADEESLKTARLRLMNDWRLQKGHNPILKGYKGE